MRGPTQVALDPSFCQDDVCFLYSFTYTQIYWQKESVSAIVIPASKGKIWSGDGIALGTHKLTFHIDSFSFFPFVFSVIVLVVKFY